MIPAARQAVVEAAANKLLLFTTPWYRFLGSLGISGADAVSITVSASPFLYTAISSGTVFVRGGTVSLIELGRNGVFTNIGVTAGPVPVSEGDVVRVTYTVIPTMTFVRR